MKKIIFAAISVIGMASIASGAYALPCAERYSSYRQRLINERYQPLDCLNKDITDDLFKEICKGTIGKGIGHTDWVNRDYNTIRMSVTALTDGDHCVVPDYTWSGGTTRLQKILKKLEEQSD